MEAVFFMGNDGSRVVDFREKKHYSIAATEKSYEKDSSCALLYPLALRSRLH
jgi:hypothetical protein